MSKASAGSTAPCRCPCAAAMPAWATRPAWPTCSSWASPPSACCRCTRHWTSNAWWRWACATTGATTRWAFFAPRRTWRQTRRTRAMSSAAWCKPCTARASRCCWMWCSTTPPRVMNTAPPCAGAAWTIPAATACHPISVRLMTTTAAAAIRWTCASRACCSWCWTACATGWPRCMWTASASTWRQCWAGATTALSATARFSRPWRKTRCCHACWRTASSSPSPGT